MHKSIRKNIFSFIEQQFISFPFRYFTTQSKSTIQLYGKESVIKNSTINLIKDVCNIFEVDEDRSKILFNEFTNNTRHFNNDKLIDMTDIMNKYQISGAKLLAVMNNYVYYCQKYSNCNDNNKNTKINNMNAQNYIKKNRYVDKLGNITIKNTFRLTINEKQIIDIDRYDTANGFGKFYKSFLWLLSQYPIYLGEYSIRNNKTKEKIYNICNTINPQNAKTLYKTFVDSVDHLNYDNHLDITRLMNQYDIESHELFHKMYYSSKPLYLRVQDFKKSDINLEEAKQLLEQSQYYIDCYNGKTIKNYFRKSKSDKQIIDIKSFDDKTDIGCFYRCIIDILNKKMI